MVANRTPGSSRNTRSAILSFSISHCLQLLFYIVFPLLDGKRYGGQNHQKELVACSRSQGCSFLVIAKVSLP